METSEYYWELVQFDGTRLEIPPQAVATVRQKLEAGEPISTRSMVIPSNQVKSFRKTDKPYTDQKLIEEAAQAFKEPIYTEVEYAGMKYTAVKARWVKQKVTQRKWDSWYAPSSYKRIGDAEDGMVTIAYVLPVHSIDLTQVQYCTPEEVAKLERG
jgi:hypothetical protein